MNCPSSKVMHIQANTSAEINLGSLEEKIKALTEWKSKAVIQLHYFHTACRLYNFCDIHQVKELLDQDISQQRY